MAKPKACPSSLDAMLSQPLCRGLRTVSLSAPTPADLLDKIFATEMWTRREGEVRAARVKAAGWVLSRDNRRAIYSAQKDAR